MKKQIGINLLKNRRVLSEKDFLREREILKYAVTAFEATLVVVIAVVSYQLVLAQKLKRIESSITSVTRQVSEHVEASAQQIYLKSRLKLIASFLDARSVAREAIQEIFSITIPGVVVSGVSFLSDNEMSVQLSASDVLSLEAALQYLEEGGGVFTQVVSEGVVRTAVGGYQLQARLMMPIEGREI